MPRRRVQSTADKNRQSLKQLYTTAAEVPTLQYRPVSERQNAKQIRTRTQADLRNELLDPIFHLIGAAAAAASARPRRHAIISRWHATHRRVGQVAQVAWSVGPPDLTATHGVLFINRARTRRLRGTAGSRPDPPVKREAPPRLEMRNRFLARNVRR